MVSCAKLITNEMIHEILKYKELIPAVEHGMKDFSNNDVIQPVRSVLPLEKYNGFVYLTTFANFFQLIISQ